MRPGAERKDRDAMELRLLVFSVGGVRFAADADHVESLRQYDAEVHAGPTVPFHEAMGYETGTVAYRCPEICTITGTAGSCGFIIESPEDIVTVSWGDLQPLPPLVESFAARRGVWAGIADPRGILLVVDLCRLATRRKLWIPQGDFS